MLGTQKEFSLEQTGTADINTIRFSTVKTQLLFL
jgi:hypothetical protein